MSLTEHATFQNRFRRKSIRLDRSNDLSLDTFPDRKDQDPDGHNPFSRLRRTR